MTTLPPAEPRPPLPSSVSGSWRRFVLLYWTFGFIAAVLVFALAWVAPWLVSPFVVANNWWAQGLLELAVAHMWEPVGKLARWILWAFEKAQDLILFGARWRAEPQYREHIVLVGKIYFQPGGFALIGEISALLGMLWHRLTRRRRERKLDAWVERVVNKEVDRRLAAAQTPPEPPAAEPDHAVAELERATELARLTPPLLRPAPPRSRRTNGKEPPPKYNLPRAPQLKDPHDKPS